MLEMGPGKVGGGEGTLDTQERKKMHHFANLISYFP